MIRMVRVFCADSSASSRHIIRGSGVFETGRSIYFRYLNDWTVPLYYMRYHLQAIPCLFRSVETFNAHKFLQSAQSSSSPPHLVSYYIHPYSISESKDCPVCCCQCCELPYPSSSLPYVKAQSCMSPPLLFSLPLGVSLPYFVLQFVFPLSKVDF